MLVFDVVELQTAPDGTNEEATSTMVSVFGDLSLVKIKIKGFQNTDIFTGVCFN